MKVSLPEDEVEVIVEHGGGKLSSPKCGNTCPGYDKRKRRWRHLDTCQLKALLVADVPRVECAEHGVINVSVPWAKPGSGFTAMFEALVIDWLQVASISTVADRMRLSWNAVDGIMQRAVKRGLSRRGVLSPTRISVDETAYRKGHDYITVETYQVQGAVLHVADNRETGSLAVFYALLSEDQKAGIESVCMDMWPAHTKATREALSDADSRIAFDRFPRCPVSGEGHGSGAQTGAPSTASSG